MTGHAEEQVHQFVATAYARIEAMAQAHSAADAADKPAIEAHIAATFEDIVAIEVLSELLGLGCEAISMRH